LLTELTELAYLAGIQQEAALLPVPDRRKTRLSVQDGDQQSKLVHKRRFQIFGQAKITLGLRL
jgi:hypothetical protein